ncbi:MAG TPA: TetR/AcrR family transcriptional regulator [Dyella sp.]|uniref:TetR/AcrR family transcriptional regulator n=1 Tax=Dyella sp. TaxID=1869338 RepID=UPI002F956139
MFLRKANDLGGHPLNAYQHATDIRERILQVASELFYREGTRAVGVDLIVARSGVAKTSLYRYFPTKDDLIREFLLREDRDFWRHWDAAANPDSAEDELFAQLQWMGDRMVRPGYRGCPQINIAAEYADEKHPARVVAAAHKMELRSRLGGLAQAMELARPEEFALTISIVIDGAFSSGGALHKQGPARFLQSVAHTLLVAARDAKTD